MPRVLTIDRAELLRVQLLRDPATGNVQVYAEYALKAGSQAVQTVHKEITPQLPSARRTALAALVDQLGQDVAASEQLGCPAAGCAGARRRRPTGRTPSRRARRRCRRCG